MQIIQLNFSDWCSFCSDLFTLIENVYQNASFCNFFNFADKLTS